jgi:hypothetical protein
MAGLTTSTASEISERGKKTAHGSKATWEFLKNPLIASWASGIESENTRMAYAYNLMRLLEHIKMTPEQFLEALAADKKIGEDRTGELVDNILKSMVSKSNARMVKAAVLSFVSGKHGLIFELPTKIKVKRTREKRPFTWEMAEKVINECPTPYREVFHFMLYGGLDENAFMRINWNEKLNGKRALEEIEEQMKNEKSYVKINLPPRKSNVDGYFVLVPKQYVPNLPALTKVYTKDGRGGRLFTPREMQAVWQRAAERTGVYYEGLGPHKLRTAFLSKCAELGISVIGEWQMGHGGDKYGYDLSGIDEQFILDGPLENGQRKGGLRRLWEMSPVVDRVTVAGIISEQNERIKRLEEQLLALGTRDYEKAIEEGKVPRVIMTEEGPRFSKRDRGVASKAKDNG